MKCVEKHIQLLLADYVRCRENLSRDDKLLIERHLENCEDCRNFKKDLETTAEAIKAFVSVEASRHISREEMLRYIKTPGALGLGPESAIRTHLLICAQCRAWHDELAHVPPLPDIARADLGIAGVANRLRQIHLPIWDWLRRPALRYVASVTTVSLAAIAILMLTRRPALGLIERSVAKSELTEADTPRSELSRESPLKDDRSAAMLVLRRMLRDANFEYERVSDTAFFRSRSGLPSPLLRLTDSSGAILDELTTQTADSATNRTTDWKAWFLTLPSRDLYAVPMKSDTNIVVWPAGIERRGLVVITYRSNGTYWPALGLKFPTVDPRTLLKRAEHYTGMGDYSAAGNCVSRAIGVWEQTRGPNSSELASCLKFASRVAHLQGQADSAVAMLLRASHIDINRFYDTASVLTPTSIYDASQSLRDDRNELLLLYATLSTRHDDLARAVADFCVSVTGISSEHEHRLINLVRRPPDLLVKHTAAGLASELAQLGSLISNSPYAENILLGNNDSHADLDSLLSKYRLLEKRLAVEAGKYVQYRDNVSVSDLASCIPPNSLFIDFSLATPLTSQYPGQTSQYFATVVSPLDEVWVVPLGQTCTVDSLVIALQRHMSRIAGKASWASSEELQEYLGIARALYREVLAPLDHLFRQGQLLLVSPDAALHLVPFDALVDDKGRYLIDRVSVHYVPAGRELLFDDRHRRKNPESGKGVIVLSGESESTAVTEGGQRFPESSFLEALDAIGRWKDSATVLIDSSATRAEFMEKAPGKSVIHLPLHGFVSNTLRSMLQEGWQLKSVALPFDMDFILTGADLYDGILRGSEVTRLPLEAADIAILSMCNSAVGNVRPGEGNRGFARAFQLAGVGTVVGALWDIPDKTSSRITPGLFKASSQTIPERLRNEKLSQRERLRNATDGRNDHPYYWAGIVSMGSWQ